MSRKTYDALNALRGVAAIAVVVGHGERLFGSILPEFALAVDVFFVLSGFVIAHAYEARLNSGLSVGQFLVIRVARFWPLYVLGLAMGGMVEIAKLLVHQSSAMPPQEIFTAWALGLFFLPSPSPNGLLFYLNPPAWSLFVELMVNLAYAAVLPVLTSRRLLLAVAAAFLIFSSGAFLHGNGSLGLVWATLGFGLARGIFGFGVGVLLYRYRDSLRLPGRVPLSILCLALVAMTAVATEHRALYDIAVAAVAAPLIVAYGSKVQTPTRFAGVCAYLGVMSYATYALHLPLVHAASFLMDHGVPGLPLGLAIILALGIACPILDRLYDRPLRRVISRPRQSVTLPAE